MSHTFPTDLFLADDMVAMAFYVKGCRQAEELTDCIENGGGCVDENHGPYTITLQDSSQRVPICNQDVFLPEFIFESCAKKQRLPLRRFRCNSPSVFNDDFDPDDVLNREMKWQDAVEQFSKTDATLKGSSSDSDSSMESVSQDSPPTKKGLIKERRSRSNFTHRERQDIVNFIIKRKSYDEVNGVFLWKRMSLKFPNHTWQSLKEHFLKRILPLIENYTQDGDAIHKFRVKRMPKKGRGRRRPPIKNAFSKFDDMKILQYVAKHSSRDTKLAGNAFWQHMEKKNVLPGRTWSSLRERYTKHLRNAAIAKEISKCAGDSTSDSLPHLPEDASKNTQQPSSSPECHETCVEGTVIDSPKTPPVEKSKSKPQRSYRHLFNPTQAEIFDESSSPISVKHEGYSMLDALVRGNLRSMKAKQQRLKAATSSTISRNYDSGGAEPQKDGHCSPTLLRKRVRVSPNSSSQDIFASCESANNPQPVDDSSLVHPTNPCQKLVNDQEQEKSNQCKDSSENNPQPVKDSSLVHPTNPCQELIYDQEQERNDQSKDSSKVAVVRQKNTAGSDHSQNIRRSRNERAVPLTISRIVSPEDNQEETATAAATSGKSISENPYSSWSDDGEDYRGGTNKKLVRRRRRTKETNLRQDQVPEASTSAKNVNSRGSSHHQNNHTEAETIDQDSIVNESFNFLGDLTIDLDEQKRQMISTESGGISDSETESEARVVQNGRVFKESAEHSSKSVQVDARPESFRFCTWKKGSLKEFKDVSIQCQMDGVDVGLMTDSDLLDPPSPEQLSPPHRSPSPPPIRLQSNRSSKRSSVPEIAVLRVSSAPSSPVLPTVNKILAASPTTRSKSRLMLSESESSVDGCPSPKCSNLYS